MKDMISVIVPIYNVEKYLDNCIESIVNQSYKNLEIILVNDGSTDNSYKICEKWQKKDPRIILISQDNGGAASAKNRGLDQAKGTFITFVDSDDFISSEMYLQMYSFLKDNDCDIVEVEYVRYCNGDDTAIKQKDKVDKEIFNAKQALKLLMENNKIRQVVWNKIYKKDMIGDIRFPDGQYIDDEYWTYKVIGNAKRIGYVKECYYYYRQHENSAIGREYNLRRLDAIPALEERICYFREQYSDLLGLAISTYLGTCLYHYQCLCFWGIDKNNKAKKWIMSKIQSLSSDDIILGMRENKMKYKVWILLFLNFPNITCKIRNLLKIGL